MRKESQQEEEAQKTPKNSFFFLQLNSFLFLQISKKLLLFLQSFSFYFVAAF